MMLIIQTARFKFCPPIPTESHFTKFMCNTLQITHSMVCVYAYHTYYSTHYDGWAFMYGIFNLLGSVYMHFFVIVESEDVPHTTTGAVELSTITDGM